LRTLKGRPPGPRFRYEFLPPEPGVIGGINASVFAGERLRIYLVFERGQYVAWASNSIEPLEAFPDDRRVLPKKLGEVIDAGAPRRKYRCR
jgi:hypothetical protein